MTALDLFAPAPVSAQRRGAHAYGQFFTPAYVAAALWDRSFSDLHAGDVVLDPACGTGRLLGAVPADIEAVGVEVDARLAAIARAETGHRVIVGDFRDVDVEELGVDAVFANPPFSVEFIDAMLERMNAWPQLRRVGSVLPGHYFRSFRAARLATQWSYTVELLPKDLFSYRASGLAVWAVFTRRGRRYVAGIALADDVAAVRGMARRYARLLDSTTVEPWRVTVLTALADLGGRAHLSAIYRQVEARRDRVTRFYREKVRQTLQRHAVPAGRGEWKLAA